MHASRISPKTLATALAACLATCLVACALALACAPGTAQAEKYPVTGDGTYGFSDVAPGDWYANDAMLGYAKAHGILKGYDDGRFGPYDFVTRGQVATILWRMAGQPEAEADYKFPDVDYARYYGDAITWAFSTGVVTGYMNSEGIPTGFGPDDFVTREQLAVMLARYARNIQGEAVKSDRNALHSMPDSDAVSWWAATAVAWCMDNKIIEGATADNMKVVQPQGTATRAQISKMASFLFKDVCGGKTPPNAGMGAELPYRAGDNKAAAQYLGQRHSDLVDAFLADSCIHGSGTYFTALDKVNRYSQYNSEFLALLYEALDYACGMGGVYDANALAAEQSEWELDLALEDSHVGSSIKDSEKAMVDVADNHLQWVQNQAMYWIGKVANP